MSSTTKTWSGTLKIWSGTAIKDRKNYSKSFRNVRLRNERLRNNISHQVSFKLRHWITGQPSQKGWNLSRTKRLIDVVSAILITSALAPLLVCIAMAIKLTSIGPVLFSQQRTGYMGRRFTMYKFRTMVEDAENLKADLSHLSHHGAGSPDFKIKNDPRTTNIGLFLRKFSLDELPQIYNVFRGDMSLVGPRPTSFSAEKYNDHHLSRLASRPGLTGLWQVSGRSDVDFEGRVCLDRRYTEEQGPMQDIKILIKTPLTVLKGHGAY